MPRCALCQTGPAATGSGCRTDGTRRDTDAIPSVQNPAPDTGSLSLGVADRRGRHPRVRAARRRSVTKL